MSTNRPYPMLTSVFIKSSLGINLKAKCHSKPKDNFVEIFCEFMLLSYCIFKCTVE